MKEWIDALKELKDNPDDLSKLPEIITNLEEHHTKITDQDEAYQEKIVKLQNSNRNLLMQIPVAGEPPKDNPEDKEVTFEEAQEQLVNAMNNVGGNV